MATSCTGCSLQISNKTRVEGILRSDPTQRPCAETLHRSSVLRKGPRRTCQGFLLRHVAKDALYSLQRSSWRSCAGSTIISRPCPQILQRFFPQRSCPRITVLLLVTAPVVFEYHSLLYFHTYLPQHCLGSLAGVIIMRSFRWSSSAWGFRSTNCTNQKSQTSSLPYTARSCKCSYRQFRCAAAPGMSACILSKRDNTHTQLQR